MSASLESLMRDQLADERPSPQPGLVTFIGIGGGAALAFILVSSVAVGLPTGLPKWLVSAICYAAFIVPVYLLHRRYSFQSRAPHGRALPRYVAVQASAVVLAALFSWVAYGVIGLPSLFAALLVSALTAGVNFIILRRWAFAD
jgi:putative flippase GtrA